jgi:predicted transporter
MWLVGIAAGGVGIYAIVAVADPSSLSPTNRFPSSGPGGAAVMGYLVVVMIGSQVARWWRSKRRP